MLRWLSKPKLWVLRMSLRLIVPAVALILLAGCAHQAQVAEAPAFDAVTSYGNKIPGRWVLFIDATALDTTAHPSGYACSAHSYDIKTAGAFQSSVRQTLENVFSQVETTPSPPSGGVPRGAAGLIIVRGRETRTVLDVIPGFWSAKMRGRVTVSASVSVDGQKGRLFGRTFEGLGQTDSESGFACEGGGKALAAAAGRAVNNLVRQMAEALGNSPRLRRGI